MDEGFKRRLALLVKDAENAVQLAGVEPVARQFGHQPNVIVGIEAVLHREGAQVLAQQEPINSLVIFAWAADHEEIERDPVGAQRDRDIDALPHPALHGDQPRIRLAERLDQGVLLVAKKSFELVG